MDDLKIIPAFRTFVERRWPRRIAVAGVAASIGVVTVGDPAKANWKAFNDGLDLAIAAFGTATTSAEAVDEPPFVTTVRNTVISPDLEAVPPIRLTVRKTT